MLEAGGFLSVLAGIAITYGPDLGRGAGWVYCKVKGPNCGGATDDGEDGDSN